MTSEQFKSNVEIEAQRSESSYAAASASLRAMTQRIQELTAQLIQIAILSREQAESLAQLETSYAKRAEVKLVVTPPVEIIAEELASEEVARAEATPEFVCEILPFVRPENSRSNVMI